MSFTLRVLLGLVAGFALGMAAAGSHSPWLARVPGLVEPAGILFVNAIRLAVIPLVVSGLIVGCATAGDAHRLERTAGRALVLILLMLGAAAAFAAVIGLLAFPHVPRPAALAVAQEAATQGAPLPSLAQWITDLVPINVFKAASDGALLPLVVFAICFGLALTGVEASRRAPVVELLRAVYDALLVFIRAVVRWTPLGVFALAVPMAARLGTDVARELAIYVGVVCGASVAFMVLALYPAAVGLGGVPLGRFSRACAATQAVAFTSRSSLAALPAAYEGARTLGLAPENIEFFLPLSASIFRVGGAIAQMLGVLFLAQLAGVTLGWAQLATVGVTVVATSLTVPGVPGGGILVMAPVLSAANIPAQGLALLLAVDSIPDMFRTTANVLGWMAGACMLERWERGRSGGASVAPAP